ncbi:pyocin activator PrtN family protein [Acinetobacter sp. CFCC 10889]|uniref:pyocin activator PrtN family protein n=1 Tax=Acinetobacter sp. CFCC 10889 TaxID=1775557 RepID=UPI000DD0225C|nr:pyocin activator PrtN family protein [Acinetobacter sp. CFCC 10889]
MGVLQFSTYDFLFLKFRSVMVKLTDVADEYYPTLKKTTINKMANANEFPFPVFKMDQKSRTAPYFVNIKDLADALDKEHQTAAKDFATFHQ